MAYVLLQCNITAVDRAYDDPDQETVEQHADQGKDDKGDELDFLFISSFRSKTNLKLKM